MRRQVDGKWSIPTHVLAHAHTVEPDSGRRHHAFKIEEDAATAGLRRKLEMAAVNGNELVALLVEAMPGEPQVSVWDNNAFKVGIVKIATMGRVGISEAVTPIPVHRKHKAAFWIGGVERCRAFRENVRREGSTGKKFASAFEEIPSIHKITCDHDSC